ncbi:hypothetical protein N7520_005586 [Penicillium odoratum]|uniref:uncharacterized protein n=1 Tax=Penicillium odoratum TaxID=1167516 RepID=UPI0025472025|nr:uncharacterized protein N7520_005586 [Penicillium odoratum]KAJ5758430.1 hypothetical protein N7520_005586 [Penicillium odoratum]
MSSTYVALQIPIPSRQRGYIPTKWPPHPLPASTPPGTQAHPLDDTCEMMVDNPIQEWLARGERWLREVRTSIKSNRKGPVGVQQ